MSLASQNLFKLSPPRLNLYYFTGSTQKAPSIRFSPPIVYRHLCSRPHFQIRKHNLQNPFNLSSLTTRHSRIGAFESEGVVHGETDVVDFSFDSILSVSEILCLVSSAVISVGFAVNYAVSSSKKTFLEVIADRVLVWGYVLLIAGVALGAFIRRRQWRRVCGETVKGRLEVNLVERIEKLEEDLRSSATIIRVLSRQLEKLGIRFRVTRKALKDPIAETAALAHKNSEATRALAVQEEILEKELGEIQKVLLAMQEQQQKQLELILAIAKTGKLFESKRQPNQVKTTIENQDSADESSKQKEAPPILS